MDTSGFKVYEIRYETYRETAGAGIDIKMRKGYVVANDLRDALDQFQRQFAGSHIEIHRIKYLGVTTETQS